MSRHRSGRVMAHVMEYWSHSAFNFNFFQIRGVSGMWSHSVSWDSHKNWARVTQTGSRVTQVRVKTTSQLEHLSVSNFSIHYYFRLRYENQDLKMTPASWDKIQFALPMLRPGDVESDTVTWILHVLLTCDTCDTGGWLLTHDLTSRSDQSHW